MTKRECAIVEAYTGACMCTGADRIHFYNYVDEIMGRNIHIQELIPLAGEIRKRAEPDFIRLYMEAEE